MAELTTTDRPRAGRDSAEVSMADQEQLYRIGKLGPVVRLLTTAPWQGLHVCEVVRAGNLRSHWGCVEHFTPGTVCWCKEHELEPVGTDAA